MVYRHKFVGYRILNMVDIGAEPEFEGGPRLGWADLGYSFFGYDTREECIDAAHRSAIQYFKHNKRNWATVELYLLLSDDINGEKIYKTEFVKKMW
jgi:hypothetical protein